MARVLLQTSTRSRRNCLALSAWRLDRIARCALAGMLCTALAGCMENYAPQTGPSDTGKEVVPPTSTAPHVAGNTQSSILIYMKSVTGKKYGWLAHRAGYQDSADSLMIFDLKKDWWARPALLYQETPIPGPFVVGGADCEVMKGIGSSSNVDVTVVLTCHTDLALKTLPKADCMKGTIMARLTTSASFFEGRWVNVVTVKDKLFIFKVDTCDKSKRIKPTDTESRNIQISFEAYARGRKVWAPKSEWPKTPERADVRVVVYARDAQLDVTGYRYDAVSSTTPEK